MDFLLISKLAERKYFMKNSLVYCILFLSLFSCSSESNTKKEISQKEKNQLIIVKTFEKSDFDSLNYKIISKWDIDSMLVNDTLLMNFKDYQSKGFVFDNELNHFDSENNNGKSSGFKSIFQGKYKVQNDSIIVTKGSNKRGMYVLTISAKRLVLKIKSSNRMLTFVCHRDQEWVKTQKLIYGPNFNFPIEE